MNNIAMLVLSLVAVCAMARAVVRPVRRPIPLPASRRVARPRR